MFFAVSNIAWEPSERQAAYELLAAANIIGLEIAPSLLFDKSNNPFRPSGETMAKTLGEIESAGLFLVSMQSLLFGVAGADLFGNAEGRQAFITGLERAIALAGQLGIPNLVLGSPKQRKYPEEMSLDDAMNRAADILRPLADSALAAGTRIAMECNPAEYGTNFLITPDEVLRFVERAEHPAITLNFDLGATHLTGTFGQVEEQLGTAVSKTSHLHISEPFLAPAPSDPTDTARVLRKLQALAYDKAVSVEMRRPDDGLAGLGAAIRKLNSARVLSGVE